MRSVVTIQARAFPVKVMDQRTGKVQEKRLVLDKAQLQAAQLVGQSSKELIERICERQGYTVCEIGIPERKSLSVALDEMWWST